MNEPALSRRGAHAASRALHSARTTHHERMLADVIDGLGRAPKELSPKYFYDARGAQLFDEITRLPEYYLTRAERRLLLRCGGGWLQRHGARTVVELGPGSGDKTRLLLDALPAGGAYVPLDISDAYLQRLADELGAAYPLLSIEPVRGDITQELPLRALRRPAVIAFLGSTIGNFTDEAASRLLRHVRAVMRGQDRFMLGVDLRKDRPIIEAAYNDAAGVTAEFNLNMLRVLNRELHADFDLDAFRHHAFYDEVLGRIEMHLVAERELTVHIGTHTVHFAAGESVRTEISAKYSPESVRALLASADLTLQLWAEDDAGYAIALAAPTASEVNA